MTQEKDFTTSRVAAFCGVAKSTVIRWIDEAKLSCHETLGGHRRVSRADLLKFLLDNKFPVPEELRDTSLMPLVVVIDDEPEIVNMLSVAIKMLLPGVRLKTYGNAIQALIDIPQDLPKIIVVDIMMPEMDGISLCQKLMENPKTAQTKIIAISGKLLTAEQQKFLDENVDVFVRKPFALDELIGAIKSLL